MSRVDRRDVIRFAGGAALAVLGATGALARPVAAPPGGFVPPAGPMRYTRKLVRTMAGGFSFEVERSFAVSFAPAAGGFIVSGEQVAVAVDAPTTLAALAALERKRVESGLFPLRLDAAGLIDDHAREPDLDGIDRVVAATRAVIERRPLSPGERDEANRFLAVVQQSAASFLSHLPADLFAPAEPRRVEERAIELPGADGTVRVEFVASADPVTRVMRTARREIVTAIEGERRVMREDWSLTPL